MTISANRVFGWVMTIVCVTIALLWVAPKVAEMTKPKPKS